jgi:ATP synthase protein I
MPNPPPETPPKLSPSAERIVRQVESRQTRILRGRAERRNFWASLAILGLVGWSVVLPTLLGAALGIWMDRRWPGKLSWTLMLLIIGLLLGCTNAWLRIKKDQL